MIESYLFIPASKPRFIEKSLEMKGVNFRIFDFEDSVSSFDVEKAILNVNKQTVKPSDWVRIPLTDQFQGIANELIKKGYRNVIVPKVKDKEHFSEVISKLQAINNEVKVIILIENYLIFLQMEQILKKWNKFIYGIGLGSHDFTAVTKIRHHKDVLFPLRLQISLLANAYNVIPIDIASMNISDHEAYNTEIQSAFDLGYRAKFVLHPFQLQCINDYPFFTKEEVKDAADIMELFFESEQNKQVVIKYKGKIYEKPHIEQLQNMVKWGGIFYGTDW